MSTLKEEEADRHPTVPYGWMEPYMVDFRLRYFTAKRRLNEGTLVVDVILLHHFHQQIKGPLGEIQ